MLEHFPQEPYDIVLQTSDPEMLSHLAEARAEYHDNLERLVTLGLSKARVRKLELGRSQYEDWCSQVAWVQQDTATPNFARAELLQGETMLRAWSLQHRFSQEAVRVRAILPALGALACFLITIKAANMPAINALSTAEAAYYALNANERWINPEGLSLKQDRQSVKAIDPVNALSFVTLLKGQLADEEADLAQLQEHYASCKRFNRGISRGFIMAVAVASLMGDSR